MDSSPSTDSNPSPDAWVATLPDDVFHAQPFFPGQRVGMRWLPEQAHPLAA